MLYAAKGKIQERESKRCLFLPVLLFPKAAK
jgi:hypothetical protein